MGGGGATTFIYMCNVCTEGPSGFPVTSSGASVYKIDLHGPLTKTILVKVP